MCYIYYVLDAHEDSRLPSFLTVYQPRPNQTRHGAPHDKGGLSGSSLFT